MKSLILIFIFAGLSGLAATQDKPRVFVQGKGSQNVTTSGSSAGGRHWGSFGSNTTLDSHDESMEVTKDLQKSCSGVMVTLNQANADYTVMLNRESKHNRGLLRTNSQVQVANRLGDILGTNATRTVGNASKHACQLILDDWGQHGRVAVTDSPAPDPTRDPAVPDPPATAPAAKLTSNAIASPVQHQATAVAEGSRATAAQTDDRAGSSVDAATNANSDSRPEVVAASIIRDPGSPANISSGLAEESLIGVSFSGSPTVRHDGVEISGVQPKGPADNIEIQPGDVILAIDGHYLYTIDELRAELRRHAIGKPLAIRYRHGRLTSENFLILGSGNETPQR